MRASLVGDACSDPKEDPIPSQAGFAVLVFLKASCSCLLAFLWRGLGTFGLLPSLLIYSQPLCFFWVSTLPVLRSIHSPTLGEFHIPPSGGGFLSASLSSSCCSALSSARSRAPGFW